MKKVVLIMAILFVAFNIAFIWLNWSKAPASAWLTLAAIDLAFFGLAWYNMARKKRRKK